MLTEENIKKSKPRDIRKVLKRKDLDNSIFLLDHRNKEFDLNANHEFQATLSQSQKMLFLFFLNHINPRRLTEHTCISCIR